jgi:hypothetical protein
MFGDILNSIKERAVEAVLKTAINNWIKGFGSARNVQVDSERKTIRLEAELNGEAAPIVVEALDYQLVQDADGTFVSAGRFVASREWLTAALNQYVAGRRFKVPAAAAMAL